MTMPLEGSPKKIIASTMREFSAGELHSGKGGPVVTDPKQALAIAYSKRRQAQNRR